MEHKDLKTDTHAFNQKITRRHGNSEGLPNNGRMEKASQRRSGEAMFAQQSGLVNREGGFCKQLQKFQAAAIKK